MSEGVTYQDTTFEFSEDGETWTKVPQLLTTPALGVGQPDTVDITNLESTIMESILALPAPDSMTFEFVAMPYDATNSNTKMLMELDNETTYQYRVRDPKLGIQVTWSGQCVHNLNEGAINTAQIISLTTMISGAFTEGPIVSP